MFDLPISNELQFGRLNYKVQKFKCFQKLAFFLRYSIILHEIGLRNDQISYLFHSKIQIDISACKIRIILSVRVISFILLRRIKILLRNA